MLAGWLIATNGRDEYESAREGVQLSYLDQRRHSKLMRPQRGQSPGRHFSLAVGDFWVNWTELVSQIAVLDSSLDEFALFASFHLQCQNRNENSSYNR